VIPVQVSLGLRFSTGYTLLQLLLHIGSREREVTQLAWSDIDASGSEIFATTKPNLKFLEEHKERTTGFP